jgi:hypothetical protein
VDVPDSNVLDRPLAEDRRQVSCGKSIAEEDQRAVRLTQRKQPPTEEATVRSWTATQTRQLPVASAAQLMERIESAYRGSKPERHNAGRWQG